MFDGTNDKLQAKTVVKRIRKTLFDMKGSHPREIHFDGRVLKRTGQNVANKKSVHLSAGQEDPDEWILPN